jgi:hypothetical protein
MVLALLLTSVTPAPALAEWGASSTAPGSGRASAATVNQLPSPTVTQNRNTLTVDWPDSTLSNGVAVTGYTVVRYSAGAAQSQPALAGCSGTLTVSICTETNVPDGLWAYAVTARFSTNWASVESARSQQVRSDGTAPVNNIWLVPGTGNSVKNGNTVYYRGAAAGSLSLRNELTDTGSGPASSTTGTIPAGQGWTHTASSVSTPAGGPFVSNPFTWTAGSTLDFTVGMDGADVAGNTAPTSIRFVNDATSPTGGAITYTSGTTRQSTLQITVDPIDDTGSGLGAASRYLDRATATLTGDTCGTFGPFTERTANPAPTQSDTGLVVGSCYRYRYRFTDSVGNETITTGAGIVKVKLTYESVITGPPTPVDYFRLADTGTVLTNAAPNSTNGTYSGGPTHGTAGALAASANTATTFDGIDDYGQFTRNVSDDFSIEFWFRSTQGLTTSPNWYDGAGLVNGEVFNVVNDFGVTLSSDGRVMAGVGNPDVTASSKAGLNNDAWHHVVMTRARPSGIVILYVDGVQAATVTGGVQALNAAPQLNIGRLPTGRNYYRGSIDEIAIYTSVLSSAQVLAHYQNAQP